MRSKLLSSNLHSIYTISPKPSLEWEEGLYLLGALAELQLGPVARNISGARRGAERIITSF
nr:hypothetical protein [Anaerobacillus isosaccharinicus]